MLLIIFISHFLHLIAPKVINPSSLPNSYSEFIYLPLSCLFIYDGLLLCGSGKPGVHKDPCPYLQCNGTKYECYHIQVCFKF